MAQPFFFFFFFNAFTALKGTFFFIFLLGISHFGFESIISVLIVLSVAGYSFVTFYLHFIAVL